MKVFVIPATYNERGNIEKLIEQLEEKVFPQIPNHSMHILVADDTSPDGTAEVVRELMKKYKNLDVNVGPKKGLGASYIRAMSYAIEEKGADVVVSIDADLQHDPVTLPAFLKKIDEGYDIVTGTRYSDGGTMPKTWPFYRKVFSVGANTLVRLITGRFYLHDWTGGYRAYRKEVFLKEREKLRSYSGYTFQVAAMYKALQDGFKAGEVPIDFYSRKVGDSKIAPAQYIVNLFMFVIMERIYELRRLVKFLVVGGTGFIMQVIVQEGSIAIGLAAVLVPLLSGLFALFGSRDSSIVADSIGGGLGAEVAILSNFLLNNFWTFSDTKHIKEQGSFWSRLIKFNIASLLSIVIQSIAVGVGETLFGKTMYLLGFALRTRILILFPTIILIVIPINYIIYNKLIWKTQYLKK